ncbi:hypothetical protein JG688_00008432 [Phytophthora aleatoria]|uniref:Uncharacterized protein n=1 Tax=Phytophthora aleatoria TaxID=2496075 RepID=A0A8J5J816_9STRA|nr:hypothetical protein JG688_00008432 [Phytophthora aleatoria]
MEASKRARASPDTDSQTPDDPKRARNSEGESLSSTSDAGDDAPSYRLEGIPFPDEILALPHVLKLVDTLAMTPEEALEEAVATRQVNWVEELVDRFECTLTDAVVHAATIGLQDIVELLLNKTFGIDEEATEVEVVIDDDTGDLVEKAIVAAAQNSHLDIPDEGGDITEELTVSELLTGMLSRLRASNTMSVDELLNPPEENVLMEDPTDEDYCRVDSNSENEIRSELSSV